MVLGQVGERGVVAALDCTHAGSWGVEALGPEGMLIASVSHPDLLQQLCRMAQDSHLRNLRAMLQRGIEVVEDSWFQCGPSAGIPLKTYRSIFLPLVREAAALAHEFGALYIYYDAGKMSGILPLLVDAGVDVIAGLQPPVIGDVSLKKVKLDFGDRVALMGGLDSIYEFELGTPDSVRSAVRQAIADAGANGGFVLDTAMSVSPETPAESLAAAAQAARYYGIYGCDPAPCQNRAEV